MNRKRTFSMKDVEIRIIAELMKNSRRSDREIANTIGVSQPTVSRTIKKLEKEGIIKEYTMIPDFSKIGYSILGATFVKTPETTKEEERTELRKTVIEVEKTAKHSPLLAVNGIGLGKSRMFITLYENYGRFAQAMQLTKSLPHVDAQGVESFLVDLNDESNYRLLSLQQVANHIQSMGKR